MVNSFNGCNGVMRTSVVNGRVVYTYEPSRAEKDAQNWWAQRIMRRKFRHCHRMRLLHDMRNHPVQKLSVLIQTLR